MDLRVGEKMFDPSPIYRDVAISLAHVSAVRIQGNVLRPTPVDVVHMYDKSKQFVTDRFGDDAYIGV